jgi:two-component system sensor histidine kinase/response regulator
LKRILLIEDTQTLAKNIADILQMEGFEVIVKEDGLKALDFLKDQSCDLIITDIVMPHMDGITLIKEVRNRAQTEKIPIIVISAKATEDTLQEATLSGSNLFLKKPCDIEYLITSVNTLLTL